MADTAGLWVIMFPCVTSVKTKDTEFLYELGSIPRRCIQKRGREVLSRSALGVYLCYQSFDRQRKVEKQEKILFICFDLKSCIAYCIQK